MNKGPKKKFFHDPKLDVTCNDLGLADGLVAFDEDLQQHKFWSPEKKPQIASSSVHANDELRNELLAKAMNEITHARQLDNTSHKSLNQTIKTSVIQQIGFDVEEKPKAKLSRKLFQ